MSKNMRKVLISLLVGTVFAAAVWSFCLLTGKPPKNASALIYFTFSESENGPVNTGVSRSVSQLRKAVTHGGFAKQAGDMSGISEDEIKKALSVERLDGSDGAEIILSGLKNTENAPIILGNIIHLAQIREDIPSFEVISFCDIAHEPVFPVIPVSAAAGIAAGGAVFAAMSVQRHRRNEYSPERSSPRDGEFYHAVFVSDSVRQVYDNGTDLGTLMPSAPEGLEKGGYISAAKKLLEKNGEAPLILAVSPARTDIDDIPYSARICAYLSCAFAALGKRTAAIECCLRKPSLDKIFGKCGKGGISEITAEKTAIWDAVVIDARKGVDIIAEDKSYSAPAATFSLPSYRETLAYLSGQYDVIILNAPSAREEEWELIAHGCTGVTIASSDGRETDPKSAAAVLNAPARFISHCNGKGSEKTEDVPGEDKIQGKDRGKNV